MNESIGSVWNRDPFLFNYYDIFLGAVAASLIGYMLPAAIHIMSHKEQLDAAVEKAFPHSSAASDSDLYCEIIEFSDDNISSKKCLVVFSLGF